jgi:hypothetical protein
MGGCEQCWGAAMAKHYTAITSTSCYYNLLIRWKLNYLRWMKKSTTRSFLLIVISLVISTGQAQQGLWRCIMPAPIIGAGPHTLADDGALLLPGRRVEMNGTPTWWNNYTPEGTGIPITMGNMIPHEGGLAAFGRLFMNGSVHTGLVFMDANGQPANGMYLEGGSPIPPIPGPWDMLVPTPDGGLLLLHENVYRLNAQGEILWARSYGEFQMPRSVHWIPNGGFYGVGSGAGIVRYASNGQPLRVMNTGPDTYGGELAVMVKHAPVLHEHKLYMGIGATFMQGGFLRSNAGVMRTDTMGNIEAVLMNETLLSPADDNTAGTHVSLAIVSGRLMAGLSLTALSGTLTYLLDCDTDLGDPQWYALPQEGETNIGRVMERDGIAVISGALDGEVMLARLAPGTLDACFSPVAHVDAPLQLVAQAGIPQGAPEFTVLAQPMLITTTSITNLNSSQLCSITSIQEEHFPTFKLYPRPAQDHVVLQLDAPPATGLVLRVTDALGRPLLEQRITEQYTRLSVERFAHGVYQATLHDGIRQQSVRIPVLR